MTNSFYNIVSLSVMCLNEKGNRAKFVTLEYYNNIIIMRFKHICLLTDYICILLKIYSRLAAAFREENIRDFPGFPKGGGG